MTDTAEMLVRLIGFDTTSRNSNLELIEFVRTYLAEHGVESALVHAADEAKANLYATIGPAEARGVALSGHTDVVPVDGQPWSSDPFKAEVRDGLLYGRGSSDMKGFIAAVLAAVPAMAARNLATPIHLCFSYDEEVGCVGVRRLLEMLDDAPFKPRGVIIGEPTEMKVVTAHKGKLSRHCHVRGREAHSSLTPAGVNAIDYAARLIAKLNQMARRKATEGPFDDAFDVPYTTIHVGVIEGGTQLNIVPLDCRFEWEIRNLPEDRLEDLVAEIEAYARDELVPEMRAVAPEAGITWQPRSSFPGLNTPEDAEIVQLAKQLTGANTTSKIAFGTEAGLFSEAGMPAVVCGPGSIAQAHKPDEFVALEQLALCDAFVARLIDRLAA